MITRRALLALLASSAAPAFGQGISSRGVKAQPRGKPSGRPFPARLTDVAKEAGLTHPVVYGGVTTKQYIIALSSQAVESLGLTSKACSNFAAAVSKRRCTLRLAQASTIKAVEQEGSASVARAA